MSEPLTDGMRAALAKAWREGHSVGFVDGHCAVRGIILDPEEEANPYDGSPVAPERRTK